MKKSPQKMFVFGVIVLVVFTIITLIFKFEIKSSGFWALRVCIALAASAISISIPGMIQVNYTPKLKSKENNEDIEYKLLTDDKGTPAPMTLAEKESTITASGAIAVFVLVYLFDPISFYVN